MKDEDKMSFEELVEFAVHYKKWGRVAPQSKQWPFTLEELNTISMKFNTYSLEIPFELLQLRDILLLQAKNK